VKGFLLAAGDGTRLRPLTSHIPKCLVPIHGTPLLEVWLNWCGLYGIDEVLINTHAHRDMVRRFVEAYRGPIRITLTEEDDLLGSAGTVRVNRAFVEGEGEFAIMYADVLTNCRFDWIVEVHRRFSSPLTVGTYRVLNPTQCGILVTDAQGKVTDFTEKPECPKSDTAFTGIMVAGRTFLEELPETLPADIGFHALPKFINRMYAVPSAEYVIDIGTLEKYDQAQREWPGLQPVSWHDGALPLQSAGSAK